MKKEFNGEIYFTPKQAARHFNLSLSTIKNYIYAGKLKTLKTPGGHHRIRRSELLVTLGDGNADREAILCDAMLSVFKTLGTAGNFLTMHARKVAELSSQIARAMAISKSDVQRIEMAGLVHDIGHIGLEKRMLLKQGLLTAEEYKAIRKHPVIGKEILNSVKGLRVFSDTVFQHHERIDGEGYPKGLQGRDIEKAARIISVTEAYDSMVSAYSYKTSIAKEEAFKELLKNKNSQFDSEVVDLFIELNADCK